MTWLFDKLQFTAGQTEFSRDMAVGDFNAAQVIFNMPRLSGGNPSVALQGSIDRANWNNIAVYAAIPLGYSSGATPASVSYPFIRAKLTSPAGVSGEISAGVEMSRQ